jgi:cupin fold WbuC family metalloprotein
MSGTEYIDAALLARLGEAARESPRRRRNHNFHRSDAAPANRLLNAVEPGSYIAPHRHLDPSKDETFVVLRGSFVLVLFDDAGGVTDARVLRAGGETPQSPPDIAGARAGAARGRGDAWRHRSGRDVPHARRTRVRLGDLRG